jgi:ATP-dependent Clp protease ATP-binding subunit ClpB
VTPSTSPQVVSRWTGIPVDKMLEGEREKLLAWKRRSASASSARKRR